MQTKHCPKCDRTIPTNQFSKSASRKDGLQGHCKSCRANWQKENPSNHAAAQSRWNLKNQEKLDRIRKNWKLSNIDRVNASTAKRRAAKLQATPPWMASDDYAAIQKFYTIANELTELNNIPHQVDHIIPLQGEVVCGLHVPWNMQVLTRPDNIAKSNKLILPPEMVWE